MPQTLKLGLHRCPENNLLMSEGQKLYLWIRLSEVKSLSRVQLFATPWTVAYQAPRSMGFSRQEYWSGLPFPPPGDLPNPGIEPGSPALKADALPSELPRLSTSICKHASHKKASNSDTPVQSTHHFTFSLPPSPLPTPKTSLFLYSTNTPTTLPLRNVI